MASIVRFARAPLGFPVLLLSLACGPKGADSEPATGDTATTDDAGATTDGATAAITAAITAGATEETTGALTDATTTAGLDEPYVYADEIVGLVAPAPRYGFTLGTLPGGRALLIGGNIDLAPGEDQNFQHIPATEVFTVDGGFAPGPALLHPRSFHNSPPAPDGGVFVLGGSSSTDFGDVYVLEIEHIAADGVTVEVVGSLTVGRTEGKTIVEPGGTLVALGDASPLAERFDPATGVSTPLPVETEFGYFSHFFAPLVSATRLPSGEVLLFGGVTSNGSDSIFFPRGPEIVDVDAGTSRQITDDASQGCESLRQALPLPDGDILLVGHAGVATDPWLVRFDVETDALIPLQTLADPDLWFRVTPHAVLLADGRVWIVGAPGHWQNTFTLTQFYDPTSNTLTPGPELPTPIALGSATAVRLDSGPVLLLGRPLGYLNPTNIAFLLK